MDHLTVLQWVVCNLISKPNENNEFEVDRFEKIDDDLSCSLVEYLELITEAYELLERLDFEYELIKVSAV